MTHHQRPPDKTETEYLLDSMKDFFLFEKLHPLPKKIPDPPNIKYLKYNKDYKLELCNKNMGALYFIYKDKKYRLFIHYHIFINYLGANVIWMNVNK